MQGKWVQSFSEDCNTASNNHYLKYKPCSHTLSIPWICWKRIMRWIFSTACLWTQNLNYFLKPYLNIWKVTYFTMPEFINGFNPELPVFVIAWLLGSCWHGIFCPTKCQIICTCSAFYDHTSWYNYVLNSSIKLQQETIS